MIIKIGFLQSWHEQRNYITTEVMRKAQLKSVPTTYSQYGMGDEMGKYLMKVYKTQGEQDGGILYKKEDVKSLWLRKIHVKACTEH